MVGALDIIVDESLLPLPGAELIHSLIGTLRVVDP